MFEKRRHVLPLFLILAIFIVLGVVFWPFIMNSIIQPITLVVWAGWRIVSSVPQKIYWGIAIGISVFLAIRMIPAKWSHDSPPKESDQLEEEKDFSSWLTTFRSAMQDTNSLDDLRRRLVNLYRLVIAQENRTEPITTDEYLRLYPLPVSRESQLFFSSEKKTLITLFYTLKLRLLTGLPALKRSRRHTMPSVLYQPIDEILSLMEDLTENRNGK